MLTVSDLCAKALAYILSIPAGNRDKTYTPSGTLANGGTLKSYSYNIQYPAVSVSASGTATLTIKTSESIPSNFTTNATTAMVTNDWNSFKNSYITNRLNASKQISISSLFLFLYLFRCFIDAKFYLYTDSYSKTSVWLYNTSTVSYNVSAFDTNPTSITAANMNTYISTLVTEIVNRSNIKTLASSASGTSSSSSSSSSSCSSSSCSSSSSSSCSSWFVAFFNLG